MHQEHLPLRKAATAPHPLGTGKAAASAPPLGAPRHFAALPPQRPRLFARSKPERQAPSPPARLAPLPSPAAALSRSHNAADGLPHRASESYSPKVDNLEKHGGESWFTTTNSSRSSSTSGSGGKGAVSERPLSAITSTFFDDSLPRETTDIAAHAVIARNSAPRNTPPAAVLRQELTGSPTTSAHERPVREPYDAAALATVRERSDDAAAFAAGVVEAKPNTALPLDGTGAPPAVGRSKRHRLAGSADTQHSLSSSTLPPPRCRCAIYQVDGDGKHVPQDVSAPRTANTPSLSPLMKGQNSDDPMEEEGLSPAPDRSCSSSRCAISCSVSSTQLGASAPAATASSVAAGLKTITSPSVNPFASADAAHSVERLVLDESVDAAAVLSESYVQQLRAEAAAGRGTGEEPSDDFSAPYRDRVVTADVLRDWTGWEDLELVTATQFRLNADVMIGIDHIGAQLPRLASLKLHNSCIPRVRQLGTGYRALKYLWLNSCHVTELSGIAACCPFLVELYLPFNHVRDLSPVVELSETLEVLDVEGNLLDDAMNLGTTLSSLHALRTLSLIGNPLACKYQARVRAAYAALMEEKEMEKGEAARSNVTESRPPQAASFLLRGQPTFSCVFASWVHCLMPELEILNDVPIDQAVQGAEGTSTSDGAPRASASRALSLHVDPFDDALAEELGLVESCIRDTDAFDALLAAVDNVNQHIYTRPSTSCVGARLRQKPRTAMGLTRPSTSTWASNTARLPFSGESANGVSSLTTGVALVGNATTSLRRRRVSPLPAFDPDEESAAAAIAVNSAARVSGTSARLGDGACHSPVDEVDTDTEDARIAALLADDSDEEEWENFKSSLLRSQSIAAAPLPNMTFSGDATAAASYHPLLPREQDAASAAATKQDLPEDGFDKELRSELTRLRIGMAKVGRTG